MNWRRVAYVGLFAFGVALPVAAGLYSKGVSKGEAAKAVLRFPQAQDAGPAVVDLARFGAIKDALQPWRVRVYVRVENGADRPYRVRVDLEGCDLPISWFARDYTWDDARRAISEPLLPGKRFGIYLFVAVPDDRRDQSRLCDGVLRAVDDESGALLATARVQIVNSSLGEVSPEVSHGHEGGHHHDGALHN